MFCWLFASLRLCLLALIFFISKSGSCPSPSPPRTLVFGHLEQELVQHNLPYDLGERTRFSGLGGIQPYVAYLQNYVLMPDLRFADPGERWRVVARVLQVRSAVAAMVYRGGGWFWVRHFMIDALLNGRTIILCPVSWHSHVFFFQFSWFCGFCCSHWDCSVSSLPTVAMGFLVGLRGLSPL